MNNLLVLLYLRNTVRCIHIDDNGLWRISCSELGRKLYGKAQIPHRFCSKPLSMRCFHARCSFPHNLEQRQNVFARGCVENYSAFTQNFSVFVCCLQIQGISTSRIKILWILRKQWTIFSPILSEYRCKITKIGHVILRLVFFFCLEGLLLLNLK